MSIKMINKQGAVFAGGGALGAYQIGAYKALSEKGRAANVKVFSGTSVGALNAAIIATRGIDAAENVWECISSDQILNIKLTKILNLVLKTLVGFVSPGSWTKITTGVIGLAQYGMFSRKGLKDIIDKELDFDKLQSPESPLVFATCVSLPFFKVHHFCLNHEQPKTVVDILLATSAIPFVFKLESIRNMLYIDGGILRNIPITPCILHNCNKIEIFYANQGQHLSEPINNAMAFHHYPRHSLGNIFNGTLNFSPSKIAELKKVGYLETLSTLNFAEDHANAICNLAKTIKKIDALRIGQG
jgi:NTE family protein